MEQLFGEQILIFWAFTKFFGLIFLQLLPLLILQRLIKRPQYFWRLLEYGEKWIRNLKAKQDTRHFVAKAMNVKELQYFLEMHPLLFEQYIAGMFRASGYQAIVTPATNDGGRDIIITKLGYKAFVECKRHRPDRSVGRPILQKLYGAKEDAHEVFCVTTSYFTPQAIEFAQGKPIHLIDGTSLLYWTRHPYRLPTSGGVNVTFETTPTVMPVYQVSGEDFVLPLKLTLIGFALLSLQIIFPVTYTLGITLGLGAGVAFILALWQVLRIVWRLVRT